ncbi:uncharacterized protein RSE6_11050 [Rhynchosporium secalis]|uniref:2EXR domain-containing protein n=1 Tax=Rhynchosporium secalis TaxID=38038 RepID=A0A1E1MM08_RHYSE|nr:uncharacterized protein RSE6_11050 [Rhynchosporium secalis]
MASSFNMSSIVMWTVTFTLRVMTEFLPDLNQELFVQTFGILTQFHHFIRLPLELRLHIWRLGMPKGRHFALPSFRLSGPKFLGPHNPATTYAYRKSYTETLRFFNVLQWDLLSLFYIGPSPQGIAVRQYCSRAVLFNSVNDTVTSTMSDIFSTTDIVDPTCVVLWFSPQETTSKLFIHLRYAERDGALCLTKPTL